MKKLKILFHIHTLTKGGAERAVSNLAEKFSEEGHEVIIATSIRCDSEYEINKKIKRVVLSDKSNNELGGPIKRMFGLGGELRKVVKKENPDVVVAFISGSIVRAVIATIGLQTKVIASVRNDPKFEYKGRLGNLIVKYIFPKVDGFVFQTEQAREYFNLDIQHRSVIIKNSVNPAFYKATRNPVANRIVTCGRLDYQKNQKLLINAFARVKKQISGAELFIYGKGLEYDKLKSQIIDLGIEDSCFLKGETSDVTGVLSMADIFVLTSDFEGMPNALIEAITMGIPCVSTDCPCGGPREIIKDGENGFLVEVNNEEQLVEKLVLLLKNQTIKEVFFNNAKKTSLQFAPEIIHKQWENFIDETISQVS